MSTFLLIAAFMAAIAASAVALPLLRNRQSRALGALAGVLVIGAAAILYPLWSNWNWHAPEQPQVSPQVLAMVARLEQRMRDDPNDIAGWLMLGRSYIALERVDDAILAYDHAHRLDANNVDAMLGLGEALSLRAGDEITPASAQLFEQAVKLAPDNPKALLYGGFAAAVRGDRATARSRWEALKKLHPPLQIEEMLDARIAELGPAGGPAGSALASGAPPVAGAAPAGSGEPSGAPSAGEANSSAAQATVNLSIAPALKSRLTDAAQLFVFAREPGSRGPPLAAKRLTSSAIGTQISLSSADSMMPGRVLVAGQRVSITARVSFSGQPLPAAGDLYGELTYDVGRDGVRDLVIDRVAQ
ncbi:MAG: tetratricopeptide repeat protein [Steroidobacteraceae bacterium]